ncbi:SusD/RagB family nutrient-binding outer membrane lipoprotein [Dyadobacter sandarakinus]|uniref:SusD/RagB family nutrient-binding outer membrane lipoprotein n=1 Tax=Dyadobacter sandarakinus TaxID=2747268 RepID=A0ABX7I3M4_9BACT|nr:SusD/RagB family nutrient-binding outer membrane lipoprotein [Dyadobacter sandarakinus]QRR00400.1 SusD/RagB family nutrient-binding outer membrane lipoprotein [Dyadobacter sandarakinus]
MKQLLSHITTLCLLVLVSSCDKGFEDVNKNPVLATSIDPGYLFSNAQFSSAIATQNYQLQIVQQINTPYTGVLEGGNHNAVSDPNSNANFNSLYLQNGPVNLLTTVISQTKDNPARSNLYHMARIWKSYVFMVLVDTYGDVPYFQAGKGFLEQINLPKYDDQKLIYDDLLKELSEGTKGLDASKAIEIGDLFYKGNIAQWKKLGNSLLLRAAMRYTKIDQNKAKQFVAVAVDPANGGLQSSNADNAFIAFNSTFNHPLANYFQGTERGNVYLGKAFVDYLKANADPRLSVIAVKYETPGNPIATAGAEDTNPANQEGMPYGYNESTIANAPGFPGKIGAAFKYSQINRKTLGKIDAPEFFITYSQTSLLLAEAVQRGWAAGDVKALYEAGVKAHMSQLATYDVAATIPAASQDAYLTAHPFTPANALEQINSQYWVSSFLNGSEAWANFRRSGFPALPVNTYPGKDPSVKDFIRRLVYPVRERSVNEANYREAVARMGPDELGTPVFWDK